jgi:ribosome assembly protein SQT1
MNNNTDEGEGRRIENNEKSTVDSQMNNEEDKEQLIEVATEDYMEDDTESVWTEAEVEDNVEEVVEMATEEEDVVRMKRGDVIEDAYGIFSGHGDESVYCVEIHPRDPSVVITGGGDDMGYLWKYSDTGEVVHVLPLEGHQDTITSVGFNYDGSLCLTGAYDGQVSYDYIF